MKEKPFNLTPSPRFLYLGEVHKEALALLAYGVTERKGFILLTGEVGTGKSTMVQALLAGLDKDVQCVYISNPLFSAQDLMSYLASKTFHTRLTIKSKANFLISFEDFLRQRLQDQKNFVLIIDEAQKLSFELLEEIRLLSNMETADNKLINIFLVGQPELNDNLSQPRCRPLLQRISIRYHIRPLDLEDSQEYITTRLKIAGSENGHKIFSKSVIKAIYQYSQGYPRVINILADNSLLLGYSREKKRLTPAIVKECYEDMKLEGSMSEEREEGRGPSEVKKVAPESSGGYWKWAVVLLVILAFAFVNTQKGQDIIRHMVSVVSVPFQENLAEEVSSQVLPVEEGSEVKRQEETREVAEVAAKTDAEDLSAPEETEKKARDREEDTVSLTMKEERLDESLPLSQEQEETSWTTIVVKEGDTLAALATRHYGRVDTSVLGVLKKNNPEINNINLINVGQKINLPPLSRSYQGPTFTVHIASFKPFQHAQRLFQKLVREGYEAYILPVYVPQKGKIFRVTIGNFEDSKNAQNYSAKIQENKVSEYARVIQIEMR
ncbi:MAG: AAA family ATPase [Desulfobacteraceae bacterium]|nr:AAA family ATPase [Desulfobacteraceae bacterium]